MPDQGDGSLPPTLSDIEMQDAQRDFGAIIALLMSAPSAARLIEDIRDLQRTQTPLVDLARTWLHDAADD